MSVPNLSSKDKVISLYKFIEEFCKSKQTIITNDSNYPWKFEIKNIPVDEENIHVDYNDSVENSESENNEVNYILKVHKPEFQKCPEPNEVLKEWLLDGWNYFKNDVKIKEKIVRQSSNKNDEVEEYFDEDEVRKEKYNEWVSKRNKWKEKQIQIDVTRMFFSNLYMQYIELQKNSETMEIIVANGYLQDKGNEDIYHPILTRRLDFKFDANKNTIYLMDTSSKTELYSELFHVLEDVNLDSLADLNADLLIKDYHPMDRNETRDYLKAFVRHLSSDSKFVEEEDDIKSINTRLLMFFSPSLIIRKRLDGTLRVVEQIIKNIEETNYIPSHLSDIVSGGMLEPIEEKDESIEETLAKAGGESIDILLSKEANREQLEIAKRIEIHNAVLVQGPPGTGKTHTIANLIGHFLANGKSVLVTSHTKKALSVLKEKLPKNIQNLCVAVLDESNDDMENSIDGITDYMSRTTSSELKNQMKSISHKREKVINDLSDIRKKIFKILNAEYKSIVLNGEEISPADAAKFIADNKDKIDYINGKVKPYAAFPLTLEEIEYLYRTNNLISSDDEKELNYKLPKITELIGPEKLKNSIDIIENLKLNIKNIAYNNSWKVTINKTDLLFETDFGNFYIKNINNNSIEKLYEYIGKYQNCEEWAKYICCDSKRNGAYKEQWETLIENIKQTYAISQKNISKYFGKKISIKDEENLSKYKSPAEKLRKILSKKQKINKLDLFMNSEISLVLSDILINGNEIKTTSDCEFLLDYIDLIECRKITANLWDELLSTHNVSVFYELDKHEPEAIAYKWIDKINTYLNWYEKEYKVLEGLLVSANLPDKILLQINDLDKDIDQINKIFYSIQNIIPNVIKICQCMVEIEINEELIDNSIQILEKDSLVNSKICIDMKKSLLNKDFDNYNDAYSLLEKIHQKNDILIKRNQLLTKIEEVAPVWAMDIRNRIGIHANTVFPKDILKAWKYKQYLTILEELTCDSLEELQEKSQKLSIEYRKITEQYAEKRAWHNLLLRTECNIDMKMALKGWELTVKKIGKATGKNAAKYKAKARELMSQCQNAVPCWIMPIHKALESLKPGDNMFDIVIIDEASQSDISSLAISYMAKKMIVVGDDKQVSPMAIGMEIDKINTLEQMYLKGKIPNSHLYSAKTSLYDIASTTFQPLMLKEHFRCVPEIIGFSNMLSYDFKIKPLRDSNSSNLLPAVINYRVNGKRIGKINRVEAETIVAAIQTCIELEEYSNKTFGVISLLGDEQVKLIQQLIFKHIEPKVIENRKILVGNASNFQGDERDVIFLSMIDSGNNEGPLNFSGNGVEDSTKKRYNVAVSRARDQVWVVNSLDSSIDLKPGDIRKKLLDYANNPKAFLNEEENINKKSESIFEERVAKKLFARGYNISQQYPVGSYRLDIVVSCENRKVVIECDGEQFHSGEDKIREDMQRQTILERIGWKFIRIRGSQFFRNEELTMNQVYEELDKLKIYPENKETENKTINNELLSKLNIGIEKHLAQNNDEERELNEEDILYALSYNKINEANRKSRSNDFKLPTSSKTVVKDLSLDEEEKTIIINDERWGKSQFKYMVLFSEGISRKEIAEYYNVAYDSVKKALHKVCDKYFSDNVDECVSTFKKMYSQNEKYKNIYKNYVTLNRKQIENIQNKNNIQENNIGVVGRKFTNFIEELNNIGIKYIDNTSKSDILWIIYDKNYEEKINVLLKRYDYSYSLEKRGSIVTNGEPAWRIMIK